MNRVTLEWSEDRFRCDDCGQWLYVTQFADTHMGTMVGAGWSLGGVLIQSHVATNHQAFTAKDLAAHGIPIP